MLIDLIISNLAIIERLHLNFGAGLTVLTGETGAGKSIIVDAVGLLLGDRARPELIRTGAEEATVEGLFDLTDQPMLNNRLAEAGLAAGEELLIRRVVSGSGRNRVWVNGSLVTLNQVRDLTGSLLAIYGQHEHQTLQKDETQRRLLDRFGGLMDATAECGARYRDVRDLAGRLEELQVAGRERQQRLDLLDFQQREIEGIAPQPGEDETLGDERRRLQHAEKLAAATGLGFDILYGGDEALCAQLDRLAGELESLTAVDAALGEMAEILRGAHYSLEDGALQLRDYSRRIQHDPQRLQEVDDRLALLAGLKRKYSPSLEGVLDYLEKTRRERQNLDCLEESREDLEIRLAAARSELNAAAAKLTRGREAAGRRMQDAVEGHLADLEMAGTRFEVRFHPLEDPDSGGGELVEFYLAPNPGEEPKPLARIASGGELSRIMLALKCASPEGDEIPTQIFDEIDAGIGGRAATAVGEKLLRIAAGHQVLCVTHLPQVAAFADRHLQVSKQAADGRTSVAVVPLEEPERVEEMARMLAGSRISDETMVHARKLIRASRPG